MKINEQQLFILLDVLRQTAISCRAYTSYNNEYLDRLYHEIIQQQDAKLVDVGYEQDNCKKLS